MKKIFSFMLIVVLLLSTFNLTVVAYDEVVVYVNNELLVTDQPAITIDGRTMVPLRAICEALNCEVTWNDETQTAQIQNNVTIVSVQINNKYLAKVDRENTQHFLTITLDVPPVIYNGRTLVPARAIAEALYAEVGWNEWHKRVDIKLEYDSIGWFNEHKLAEVTKNGKYGYINEARQEVVPVIYDLVGDFYEGYVAVCKSGKWGFISADGAEVIPCKFDSADRFSEGLAAVKQGDKWGFIDTSGRVRIEFIYDNTSYFSQECVAVKKGNKWGYVSNYGVNIIPFNYDSASPFFGGNAAVKANGKCFDIDKSGKKVNW